MRRDNLVKIARSQWFRAAQDPTLWKCGERPMFNGGCIKTDFMTLIKTSSDIYGIYQYVLCTKSNMVSYQYYQWTSLVFLLLKVSQISNRIWRYRWWAQVSRRTVCCNRKWIPELFLPTPLTCAALCPCTYQKSWILVGSWGTIIDIE